METQRAQPDGRFEPSSLLLLGNSADPHATMLPCIYSVHEKCLAHALLVNLLPVCLSRQQNSCVADIYRHAETMNFL